MVKKICPICDQVMKSSHFCRGCRSWIRHPYERDVNYYLNERHPGYGAPCDYHGAGAAPPTDIYADEELNRLLHRRSPRSGGQMPGNRGGSGSRMPGTRGGSGSQTPGTRGSSGSQTPGTRGGSGSQMPGTRGGSGSQMPGTRASSGSRMPGTRGGSDSQLPGTRGGSDSQLPGTRGGSDSQLPGTRASSDSQLPGTRSSSASRMAGSSMPGGAGNGPQVTAELVKSGKGAYIVVAAAIGIVLLIAVGVTVIGVLRDSVSHLYSDSWSYEDDSFDPGEWLDGNYRELEDDEVKAAGVHCNAFYHFLTKEEALAPAVSDAILSAGYKIASESTYSYNEAVLEEEDEWTYYSTNHTIYVAEDGMAIRDDLSQWVELNSDTATGELHTYASQLADQTKSLMIMTEFVKGIESGYGIGPGESCVPQITRNMQSELDTSGSYVYESDLFYITAQMYSDGVHLQVSCNQED